ncbi:hypothetical protein BJ684DRAFT_20697 [Piptocephalis cylindrospora]|uniref:Uncharacterized protein n=1 Tax=Piptocephalis cylindrospora TaxID=1907219 RepID=A0A4V1IXZ5_9FUNG|nr:hypothetical protein BJ684DRAFT_20697 [Piptocephalis cylindrospora]|eukprot:RKP12779.1 hypothetical protein BJ684DRAFT_20697 [Piptocephalis cylindrospora]
MTLSGSKLIVMLTLGALLLFQVVLAAPISAFHLNAVAHSDDGHPSDNGDADSNKSLSLNELPGKNAASLG